MYVIEMFECIFLFFKESECKLKLMMIFDN